MTVTQHVNVTWIQDSLGCGCLPLSHGAHICFTVTLACPLSYLLQLCIACRSTSYCSMHPERKGARLWILSHTTEMTKTYAFTYMYKWCFCRKMTMNPPSSAWSAECLSIKDKTKWPCDDMSMTLRRELELMIMIFFIMPITFSQSSNWNLQTYFLPTGLNPKMLLHQRTSHNPCAIRPGVKLFYPIYLCWYYQNQQFAKEFIRTDKEHWSFSAHVLVLLNTSETAMSWRSGEKETQQPILDYTFYMYLI